MVLSGKAKGLEAEGCDSLLARAGERMGGRTGVPALERYCKAHTTDDAGIAHHGEPVYQQHSS